MEFLPEMEDVQETLVNLMTPGVDQLNEAIAAEDADPVVTEANTDWLTRRGHIGEMKQNMKAEWSL